MTLDVRADRSLIRAAGDSTRYVLVSISAPAQAKKDVRLPVNLSLVVDRSGSMEGAKLNLARTAALQAARTLRDEDRLSVVFYDDQIEVIVPSTPVTPEARARAERELQRVQARGYTDLCGGWLTGCDQVAQYLTEETVGRTLLLTDGLANRGITDHGEIVRHVSELRRRRVSTSTFGIGADFDESLLRTMADAGGGRFYFVEHATQIPDFVAGETGEALEVVARDVVLRVELPEGIVVESMNEFVCRRDGTAWRIELGDLVSRQQATAVVKLTFPLGVAGETQAVNFRVNDRDEVLGSEQALVTWTFAGHAENDRQPRERVVDRRVAELYAAQAEQRAVRKNRSGDFEGARRTMLGCARRIGLYAGDDRTLRALVRDLEEKAERFFQQMSEIHRKHAYYGTYAMLKDRGFSGRARRSGAIEMTVFPTSHAIRQAVERGVQAVGLADPELFGNVAVSDGMIRNAAEGARPPIVLSPAAEAAVVSDAMSRAPAADLRIVFTSDRLVDNWFSHWHGPQQTVVASFNRWTDITVVSAAAFVAYELVLHGLHHLSSAYDHERLAHSDTRGCLFDFCRDKTEVEIKLQAADLCQPCRVALGQLGIDVQRVATMCDAIRATAVIAGSASEPSHA